MPETTQTGFFEDIQLQAILSSIHQSVILTTPELDAPHPIIVYANQHVFDVTGYTAEELIGQSPRIFQGEATDHNFLRQIRATLQTGNAFVGSTTNYRKDGTPFCVELNISPLRDDAGNIEYYLGIQRELDVEIALEASRTEASLYKTELETYKTIRQAYTGFVSGFTQQLRDPLSVIRLNAETMLRYSDKLSGDALMQKTSMVVREVDYLTELLNDVIVISQLGKTDRESFLPLELSSIDVCVITSDIVRRLQSQFPERADDLTFYCTSDTGSVKLDFRLFRYIITHLIVNAITYSNQYSPVEIELMQSDSDIVFRVTDQGDGIPHFLQEQILEPFYRAPNSSGTSGTGLGLTIVKASVNTLKGQLSIESADGHGTTVTVTIPMEQSHEH